MTDMVSRQTQQGPNKSQAPEKPLSASRILLENEMPIF